MAGAAGEAVAGPEDGREATRIQGGGVGDRIYDVVITTFAAAVPVLLVAIFAVVTVAAWPALKTFGFSFLTSSEWDPVK
ncbi:MAG TPA: hypothetical protein VJ957_09990, partial [Longimicrobiales bacterium]|nr:hypothetical protein [Longimicrobiales bacterium]